MRSNRRRIVFVIDADCNCELIRSQRTCNLRLFSSGIILNRSLDDKLTFGFCIERNTTIYLHRTIRCHNKPRVSGNLRENVGIHIYFVRLILRSNRSYDSILGRMFCDREIEIIGRRFIVYRNDINRSLILDRCIVTHSIANNFIFESRIAITKVICSRLINKLGKISYSNFLPCFNRGTIKSNSTLCRRRNARENNGCKFLCSMLELEFSCSELMLGIFIDVNNKLARDRRSRIITYNVDFVTLIGFIIRCCFSSLKVTDLEPKLFIIFDKTINQRLDIDSRGTRFSGRNCDFGSGYSTNRKVFSINIFMPGINTINPLRRLEIVAIIERYIILRNITQHYFQRSIITFFNLFRVISYEKFNLRVKPFKDKVFCTNFITDFDLIGNKLTRKYNITHQRYFSGTYKSTHNGHVVNIFKGNIVIHVNQ